MTRKFVMGHRPKRVERPSQLTADVEEKFLTAIKTVGPHIDDVAQMCGLDPRTVRRWIERGRGNDVYYRDRHGERVKLPRREMFDRFAAAYDAAVASWRVFVMGITTQGVRQHPQIGITLLDRFGGPDWMRALEAGPIVPASPDTTLIAAQTNNQTNNYLLMDPEVLAEASHAMLELRRKQRAIDEPEIVPMVVTRPIKHADTRSLRAGLREDGT